VNAVRNISQTIGTFRDTWPKLVGLRTGLVDWTGGLTFLITLTYLQGCMLRNLVILTWKHSLFPTQSWSK